MSSWFDAAFSLRERLLSSAQFQRFAAAFPLTRPIARRRARALFDLVAAFVYSQILAACVRLNLFSILAASGPQTVAELSTRLELSLEATQHLLSAAKALDLLEARGDGRFALGPLGAALIGNPGIVAMIEHVLMIIPIPLTKLWDWRSRAEQPVKVHT